LKFIDILIETLEREISNPSQIKEILYFLIMDLALKSNKLSERKAWETIASLVSLVWSTKRFPSADDLTTLRSEVNSLHRNKNDRTSFIFDSLKMFELGEASVRKFLHEKAWKGLAGFDDDGKPLR
jgi:hypothetical protein